MVVAVDFVAGRVQERAFCAVPLKGSLVVGVAEAELADVDHIRSGIGRGVGGEVPRLHFVLAHLDAAEITDAGDFGLVLGQGTAGAEFFDFFFTTIGFVGGGGGFGGGGSVLEVDEVEVGVFRFGGAGGDFGGDDGDGSVAAWTVFFSAD